MMKESLKRYNIAIICGLCLLGVAFGMGICLLILTLTNPSSGLTLAGLICLIVAMPVSLVLLFIVRAREIKLSHLEQMENLFGKGNDILTQKEFYDYLNKPKCRADKVYALHMKLGKGAQEENVRFARLSLCDLLCEKLGAGATIGFTAEADFLFVLEKELDLQGILKEIDRHLKRNPRIISYGIYVGVAAIKKKEAAASCEQAIRAAYADTAIRPSLSINALKPKNKAVEKIDFQKELEAKRLRFPAIDYVDSKGNHLYYLTPELYDPSRGPIRDKDFRSFVSMADQESEITSISIDKALESLSKGLVPGPVAVEVSLKELLDPAFVPSVSDSLIQRKLKLKKLVIFLPSTCLTSHEARLAMEKLKGMRIPFGIYEFGEEKLAELAKAAPAYVRFKSEYVRDGADESLLKALIGAVKELGITPLLKAKDLLSDTIDFKESDRVSLEEDVVVREEEEETTSGEDEE